MHDGTGELLALTDLLYEAGLETELWPFALARIGQVFGAEAVSLVGIELPTGESTFRLAHGLDQAEQEHAVLQAMRFARSGELGPQALKSFLVHDSGTEAPVQVPWEQHRERLKAMLGEPYYLLLRLYAGPEHMVVATLRRRSAGDGAEAGLGQRLQRLAPHLERALQVSQRVAELNAHSAATEETLERLPVGVFMLDREGQVCFINSEAHAILEGSRELRVVDGRLRALRADEDEHLQSLIGAAFGVEEDPHAVMLVGRGEPRRPLSISVRSIRRESGPFFPVKPLVGVFATDPDRRKVPPRTVLQQIYGFTKTEARLACLLMGGATLEQAAEHLSITRGTVRVHLERVFRKTGTHRQAELLRVLLTSPPMLK